MRRVFLVLVLFWFQVGLASADDAAKDIWLEMPFGVVLGETQVSQISGYGRCEKYNSSPEGACDFLKVRSLLFRLSNSGVVRDVLVSEKEVANLPRQWRFAGLNDHDLLNGIMSALLKRGMKANVFESGSELKLRTFDAIHEYLVVMYRIDSDDPGSGYRLSAIEIYPAY